MSWWNTIVNLTEDDFMALFEKYEALGPLPGILLPFIEAFLPFLPIIVIIIANALAYDLWEGFIYSWIGIVLGAFCIFLLTRRYGGRFGAYIRRRYPKGRTLFEWVETKGFSPIFILSCLPFAPSFLVNIFSGLSKVAPLTFLLGIMFGKAFMVFLISLVGSDFFSIIYNPWKLILVVSLFGLVWIIGKHVEVRYRKKYKSID